VSKKGEVIKMRRGRMGEEEGEERIKSLWNDGE
jgi:hypothetical protein